MPDFQAIEVAAEGRIGRIRLNRPDKLNALSGQLLRELIDAADWFNQQSDVRVVIVSGNGRAFSAGADISDTSDDQPAYLRSDLGRQVADALEGMTAVTIAAIHGYCVGGAVVLAAACDLRLASDDTHFSIPEVDLGIPLAWGGIPRLVREIGPAATKDLVMTCRTFTAVEARDLGFLTRVVAPEVLESAVNDLAAKLAEKPGLPLLATKRHVDAVTSAMVGLERSWSDAHSLIAARHDPESQQVGQRYRERLRER